MYIYDLRSVHMNEYGILTDPDEIKLMVMYALKCLGQPSTEDYLNEIIMSSGRINYFDKQEAFEALLKSGNILKETVDETDYYILSDTGIETLSQLEMRLPYSMRERALKDAIKLKAKMKKDSELITDIKEIDNGCYITCKILDNNTRLLDVTILVANKEQAEIVAKTFKNNPDLIYSDIISALTKDIK